MPAATANPIHPLSLLQEGMLSHRSAGGPSGVDLVQIEVTLAGALPAGFESAWNWLARRHAVLRTAFRVDGSRPVQEVRAAIAPEIVREDWSATTGGARSARWTHFLARDRNRG